MIRSSKVLITVLAFFRAVMTVATCEFAKTEGSVDQCIPPAYTLTLATAVVAAAAIMTICLWCTGYTATTFPERAAY